MENIASVLGIEDNFSIRGISFEITSSLWNPLCKNSIWGLSHLMPQGMALEKCLEAYACDFIMQGVSN